MIRKPALSHIVAEKIARAGDVAQRKNASHHGCKTRHEGLQ